MATKTTKVKAGQTYASLAKDYQVSPQELIKLNKGVPSLSQGQVVKVPVPPQPIFPPQGNQGNFQYNNPITNFGITAPVVQNSLAGSHGQFGGTYQPLQPPAGEIRNQLQPNTLLGGRGTMNPVYQPAASGLLPPAGEIRGTQSGQVNAGSGGGDNAAADTNKQFPGYWGGGKKGGFFKTLREAKFATKRKNDGTGPGDNSGGGSEQNYAPAPVVTPPPQLQEIIETSLTWRVG
jgi:LysM repeat protein